jgi:hypothetical protein
MSTLHDTIKARYCDGETKGALLACADAIEELTDRVTRVERLIQYPEKLVPPPAPDVASVYASYGINPPVPDGADDTGKL